MITRDMFGHILTTFDGFNTLFRNNSQIKISINSLQKKLISNRSKTRGLALYSHQILGRSIKTKLQRILSLLNDQLGLIRRNAGNYIKDYYSVEFLNPFSNNPTKLDADTMKRAEIEITSTSVLQLADSSSFQLEYESVVYYNPYIRRYKGFSVRLNREIEVFAYDKDTLR